MHTNEPFPQSWTSLEQHPPLRPLTQGEFEAIRDVRFLKSRFTPRLTNDLITLYAKAVGYENEKQVEQCQKTVGFWDYRQKQPQISDEPIDFDAINGEWRIGSPDWSHTKLIVSEHERSRALLRVNIDPNTPYDWNGYTERDIKIMTYFAQTADQYLKTELFSASN
jgi:hypothetical protein